MVIVINYIFHCCFVCLPRAILNVCFAYTAQDDMSNAMKELALGVQAGAILER